MPRPIRLLTLVASLAIGATASAPARAEPAPAGPAPAGPAPAPPTRWRVSAEGDVLRLALGSLSFHVMVRPAPLPRLRLSLGRVGGELPAVFHRLFDPNKGWEAREQGAVLQAFYHLRDEGSTLFLGLGARFEAWEWRRPEVAGKATGQQLFVMPSVGFRWFPADGGLFVTPWVGLGVS
ncbi:MAG: hypothetical protein EOO75_07005, partial [Myxococcales bacterium]